MGMRLVATYTHSEQSKIIVYLMGNDSGQSGLQGPVGNHQPQALPLHCHSSTSAQP